jgi:hypothetical protein
MSCLLMLVRSQPNLIKSGSPPSMDPGCPHPLPHSLPRSPSVFQQPPSTISNLPKPLTLPLAADRRQGGTRPNPPPVHLHHPEQHEKGPTAAAATLWKKKREGEGVEGWSPAAAFLASPSGQLRRRRGREGWGRGARARVWRRPESPARERHGARVSYHYTIHFTINIRASNSIR